MSSPNPPKQPTDPRQACTICGSTLHTNGYHDSNEPTGYHDSGAPATTDK